jgi:Zn-finger nucleic acid-binding protein
MGAAGALSCPKCGATADPDAVRCEFCKAKLATVACPACFSKFFRGFSNCPYCGTEAEREAIRSSALRCPKCAQKPKLVAVRIGETMVEECGECAGMWLAHAPFEQLQAAREEHVAILGMPASVTVKHPEVVRYYPCPACAAMMNRVNFARCSGVIVDVCKTDGVWFDADELRAIVSFIHSGGLIKARDREVERLRDEVRAAQSAQRQLQLERDRDGAGYSGAPIGQGSLVESVLGVVGGLLRHFS